MHIIIVGGGSVGKTIARDLVKQEHQVTIVDFELLEAQNNPVEGATWISGDACSPDVMEEAGVDSCDVLVTATGDDKANLVASMVAKTGFNVPKTIARINHPKNAYLFDSAWGVDFAISMPDAITSLIEDKVLDEEMVEIYHLNKTDKGIFKYRLGDEFEQNIYTKSNFLAENPDVTLVAIVRGSTVINPNEDLLLEPGDELFLLN
jgi:trk system potassium uptake protein TrkA